MRSTAVTSSRKLAACDARTSPKNCSTNTCGLSRCASLASGTTSGSRSPSHPGDIRGSESSFASLARLCDGNAAETALTYSASASARFAASAASFFAAPPPGSDGSFGILNPNPPSDAIRRDSSSSSSVDFVIASASAASANARASASAARSISSSTSSNSGKSSSGVRDSSASASESLLPLFAARAASARIRRAADAISARNAASFLAHVDVARSIASRSFTVSLPSVLAYFFPNDSRLRAISTASAPPVASPNAYA